MRITVTHCCYGLFSSKFPELIQLKGRRENLCWLLLLRRDYCCHLVNKTYTYSTVRSCILSEFPGLLILQDCCETFWESNHLYRTVCTSPLQKFHQNLFIIFWEIQPTGRRWKYKLLPSSEIRNEEALSVRNNLVTTSLTIFQYFLTLTVISASLVQFAF